MEQSDVLYWPVPGPDPSLDTCQCPLSSRGEITHKTHPTNRIQRRAEGSYSVRLGGGCIHHIPFTKQWHSGPSDLQHQHAVMGKVEDTCLLADIFWLNCKSSYSNDHVNWKCLCLPPVSNNFSNSVLSNKEWNNVKISPGEKLRGPRELICHLLYYWKKRKWFVIGLCTIVSRARTLSVSWCFATWTMSSAVFSGKTSKIFGFWNVFLRLKLRRMISPKIELYGFLMKVTWTVSR